MLELMLKVDFTTASGIAFVQFLQETGDVYLSKTYNSEHGEHIMAAWDDVLSATVGRYFRVQCSSNIYSNLEFHFLNSP